MSFKIVLWEPRIPQNVGAIGRLCVASGSSLHLVGQLGFLLNDRYLARAALDYWSKVRYRHFPDAKGYLKLLKNKEFSLYSTKAKTCYTQKKYHPQEYLIFGAEDRGLPAEMLKNLATRAFYLPIKNDKVRSLNLNTSVAIVLYEALRQNDFFSLG